MSIEVRPAREPDLPAVMNVLDGGLLDAPVETVRAGMGEATLVATAGGQVVGALVLDGERVAGVAVRPRRRGQGIGTALVAAAADRRDRLVAACREGVAPFYAKLGFDLDDPDEDGRVRGVLRDGVDVP